jgi:ELWxxDGT repeat protein
VQRIGGTPGLLLSHLHPEQWRVTTTKEMWPPTIRFVVFSITLFLSSSHSPQPAVRVSLEARSEPPLNAPPMADPSAVALQLDGPEQAPAERQQFAFAPAPIGRGSLTIRSATSDNDSSPVAHVTITHNLTKLRAGSKKDAVVVAAVINPLHGTQGKDDKETEKETEKKETEKKRKRRLLLWLCCCCCMATVVALAVGLGIGLSSSSSSSSSSSPPGEDGGLPVARSEPGARMIVTIPLLGGTAGAVLKSPGGGGAGTGTLLREGVAALANATPAYVTVIRLVTNATNSSDVATLFNTTLSGFAATASSSTPSSSAPLPFEVGAWQVLPADTVNSPAAALSSPLQQQQLAAGGPSDVRCANVTTYASSGLVPVTYVTFEVIVTAAQVGNATTGDGGLAYGTSLAALAAMQLHSSLTSPSSLLEEPSMVAALSNWSACVAAPLDTLLQPFVLLPAESISADDVTVVTTPDNGITVAPPSASPSPTASSGVSPSPSGTPTPTPSPTASQSTLPAGVSSSTTPTPTPAPAAGGGSASSTPSPTPTPTGTPTPTPAPAAGGGSASSTPSPTPTPTGTPTPTPTPAALQATSSASSTASSSATSSATGSPTASGSVSVSATGSPTASGSVSVSATGSPTASGSASASASPSSLPVDPCMRVASTGSEGAYLVRDVNDRARSSAPSSLSCFKESLVFAGTSYDAWTRLSWGSEMWMSNGAANSTAVVKDVNDRARSSAPSDFTECGGQLYFTGAAYDPWTRLPWGRELFVTNGTTEGTRMVKDINGRSRSSAPSSLTCFKGKLYFAAASYDAWTRLSWGRELWTSDGTSEGTVMVKDVNDRARSGAPASLTCFNDTLFFSGAAYDPWTRLTWGSELWMSNGTTEGTVMVKDTNDRSRSGAPTSLTKCGRRLFYTSAVYDPWTRLSWGRELFAYGAQP